MSNDNILRMALNNLPSGRTGLSNTNANETEHWEPKENGTFELKTYRTIEQTEIIAELGIDSRNPTISEFITKSEEKKSKRPNNSEIKRTENERNVKPRMNE